MVAWAAAVCLASVMAGQAAVLYTATFDVDTENWTGPGFVTFTHDGVLGNPPGSLAGELNPPSPFLPQGGAFRADSSSSLVGGEPAFTGDYLAVGATGFRLDFLAQDVIPSGLAVVIEGAGHSFARGLSVPGNVGTWVSYAVPFHGGMGWEGGTDAEFMAMLADVTSVQVQVVSSGTSSQWYNMDNFQLSGEFFAIIPEPGHGLFFLGAALILMIRRRRFFPSSS